jgi:hypothetical protein
MTPRERLTNCHPGLGGTHEPGDRPDRRHQRTGHQESSSKHVRQARRVEPAGVGHVRRQPWWKELAGSRRRARPLSPGRGS